MHSTLALLFAAIPFAASAGEAYGQKSSTFTATTDDGYPIHGEVWLAKKGKDAKAPLVVFIHDANGRRSQFADAAAKFYQAGFAAITFDLRGHNESTRDKDGKTIELDKDAVWGFMRRDVACVMKYAAELGGVDSSRVVFVGAGFGAILGLKIGVNDDGVKAIVGLSTPLADTRTKDDASKYIEKLGSRALLLITGKSEDDKKAAKDIGFYASKGGSKAYEVKSYPVDAKGADLFVAKPTLGAEILAWVKKSVDPSKKP